MRYTKSPLRPGATAIAAVLALSSTPLFAQEAEPAPPLVTPPPVVAPAPAAPAPVVAPVVQSAPAPMAATPAPSISTADVAESIRADEASSTTTTRSTITRSTPVRTASPAPVARTVQAAPAVIAPVPVPVAKTAAPPPPMAKKDGKVVFDPQPAPAPVEADGTADDTLALAGFAGAAALLAAGGAYALRRRRRPEDDEVYIADEVTLSEPVPVPAMAATGMAPAMAYAAPRAQEPSFPFAQPGVTQPIQSPESASVADAPATTLPNGFDISRFGRHTQAAYRGPTPENRSLSLKKRLKVASFYDGRERMAAEGRLPPQSAPLATAQPAQAPRQPEYVTTRVKQPSRPGFRPAFSS